jgi:hypothetical protein
MNTIYLSRLSYYDLITAMTSVTSNVTPTMSIIAIYIMHAKTLGMISVGPPP